MGELLRQENKEAAKEAVIEKTAKAQHEQAIGEQLINRLENALGRIAYSLEKKKKLSEYNGSEGQGSSAKHENVESVSASLDMLIAQIREVLDYVESDSSLNTPDSQG
ncbi:hypothetical protein JGUZn3_18070 [Entomobacter blattae]|uniref:Uncharacterized protein n=2 Tax=Entomobacter blattae TaxID=2762277 RepID=A0A7H1NTB1_9PROT|nr:hypothetical protein JGUZn3_18070 [Entomobacter blattae]